MLRYLLKAISGSFTAMACLSSIGLLALEATGASNLRARTRVPVVAVRSMSDSLEAERLLRASERMPFSRRIEFLSRYFVGRRYPAATKKRIKKQRKKVPGAEARNRRRLPVEFLRTSLWSLDCMTYVEHVIALANARSDYRGSFLLRLVDVMFAANGLPLTNDRRNHFMSVWAAENAKKGYLNNVASDFSKTNSRTVTLNKVGENRTKYVEDRFMIAEAPWTYQYVPRAVLREEFSTLSSGDILCMVRDIEGLDIAHVGFAIESRTGWMFRHASWSGNKVVDQSLGKYLDGQTKVLGCMVLRPTEAGRIPPPYRFVPERK